HCHVLDLYSFPTRRSSDLGYRFSDKNFVTMNEYINDTNHYTNYQNEKESYIVTFNQYLESLRLNTYVSLARNTYWDASSNVNYSDRKSTRLNSSHVSISYA